MTLVTGFVTEFWQLALLRIGLGIGQAGCNPLATSLIADYFSVELRGSAISVYNWGIYTGYSLSFAIGNQILKHLVNLTIIKLYLYFCNNNHNNNIKGR